MRRLAAFGGRRNYWKIHSSGTVRKAAVTITYLHGEAHVGAAAASREDAQRLLSPYAYGSGVPVGRALARTTAALRRSPTSFARFIGDFRNAALNAS
jgi:hypothetical protein